MNYGEANIPVRAAALDWSKLEQGPAVEAVTSWVMSYPNRWVNTTALTVGRGLLLHGDTGSGKTTAASLALKHVIDCGHAGWFVPVRTLEGMLHQRMDLGAYMRKTDSGDPDLNVAFEQINNRLIKVRFNYYVTVLDDWGRDRTTSEFLQEYIEGLLRERFNRGLPSIITTNLDPDEIESRFGRPFTSFLREACVFVDFGSRDFRGAR